MVAPGRIFEICATAGWPSQARVLRSDDPVCA
jgi:hypothetical protein